MSEDYSPRKRPVPIRDDGLPYGDADRGPASERSSPRPRPGPNAQPLIPKVLAPVRPLVSSVSRAEHVPEGSNLVGDSDDALPDREARKKRRLAILAKYKEQSTSHIAAEQHAQGRETEDDRHADAARSQNQQMVDLESSSGDCKDQIPSSAVSASDIDPHRDSDDDRGKRFRHLMHEKSKLSTNIELGRVPQATEDATQHGAEGEVESDAEFDIFAPIQRAQMPSASPAIATVTEVKDHDSDLNVPIIRRTALQNIDDADGYYLVIPGELLDDRYHVFATLGRGMFSTVVKAWDTTSAQAASKGREVAVKIVRNNEVMQKAGMKEIEILNLLQSQDPSDRKHLIRLERYFDFRGHLCMVFESLAMNLREVIKRFGKDLGLSLQAVKVYSQQIFAALAHLRKCGVIHADLKPDNILVNESKNILKICDLGSASDGKGQEITPYLVSRFYRAPEVILGLSCDSSIDTWSIGCTLFELYTGKILFAGRSNNQMLRSIQECRGKMPHRMIKKGPFGVGTHFDEELEFVSVELDKITGANTSRKIQYGPTPEPGKDLRSKILPQPSTFKAMKQGDRTDLTNFVDLLEKLLMLAPEKRILPKDALLHPFLRTN